MTLQNVIDVIESQFALEHQSEKMNNVQLICSYCRQSINVLASRIFTSYCGLAFHEHCMNQQRNQAVCICGQPTGEFFEVFLNVHIVQEPR